MDVLVEIDVGQGRCGVPPGEAAVALALAVARHPRLRFAGLQAYHGRAQHFASAAKRREAIARAVQQAAHTRDLIEAAGVPVPLVTGSGTGSLVNEAAELGMWIAPEFRINNDEGLPLAPEEYSDQNKVRGCSSQVWLVAEASPAAPGALQIGRAHV